LELTDYLDQLKREPKFVSNVVYWGKRPKQSACFSPVPQELHPALKHYLEEKGISNLYSHQHECYRAVAAGRDTVITTPTASGKSLAYNLPVLDALLKDRDAKALYLFPTKALSQDQAKIFRFRSSGFTSTTETLPVPYGRPHERTGASS